MLGHVQHQQRLHPVEREALPELGPGEEAERLGMAEKGRVGAGMVVCAHRPMLMRSAAKGSGFAKGLREVEEIDVP